MSTNPYESPTVSDLAATPPAKSLVGLALVSLHISAALYLLLAVFLTWLFAQDELQRDLGRGGELVGIVCGAFCVVLAAGVEVVAYGIHKRKFWAWVAGLAVFAMYSSSAFLPLGALGLWGLLAPGSRIEFGIGRPAGQAQHPPGAV